MESSKRKHFSQMSEDEKNTILNFAKRIPMHEWEFNPYTEARIRKRGGNKEIVLHTLNNGELIEYHLRNNRSRILLRGTKPISEYHPYVPCAVFELKSKKIITVYWNHTKDNHRTIDMKQYEEDLNVIKEFIQSD